MRPCRMGSLGGWSNDGAIERSEEGAKREDPSHLVFVTEIVRMVVQAVDMCSFYFCLPVTQGFQFDSAMRLRT